MTLTELHDILGENVRAIHTANLQDEESAKIIEKSEAISRLAKQMINNADIILRTDKLVAEGKLTNSVIVRVVGTHDAE